MKIKVPTELKDIKLHQVQSALLIAENPDIDDFAKKVHSVAVMTDRTPVEVGQIMLVDLDLIHTNIFNMINGVGDAPLQPRVKYLNREYGFVEDVRDMETAAFVDIDQMCLDDKYAENLHRIMAVLYRPIEARMGDKYRLKSYARESAKDREERQKIFLKHMTLDVVRGATGFFLLVTQNCLNISPGSFPEVEALTVEKVIHGAGITSSIPVPEDS